MYQKTNHTNNQFILLSSPIQPKNNFTSSCRRWGHPKTTLLPRTIPDPEFPDDKDEVLFFVLVEFNVEDIRELRRITALELKGELDADGVKAFVEVSWFHLQTIFQGLVQLNMLRPNYISHAIKDRIVIE